MKVNGTLMNYYFHCRRQCYLHGNRVNLEDNSENVQIGKAIHEEKAVGSSNSEIAIENIKLDKLTAEYLTEIKKSDADEEAAKWQLYYYLYVLKTKGIVRKGRLQFVEKNKKDSKTLILELTPEIEKQLNTYVDKIEDLLEQDYAYPHLFVYRDEFYYPLRKMLNHKEICLTDFVNQMRKQKKYAGFVNYAASNDGFTLADVFMYSEKHNEANGENNADGNDWNYSDNYGIEGPTRKKYIESLRKKQLRNAITAVFLAQGIPLLAAGDEIGNSQRGNNNAYCQDNAVGWVNWKNDKKYASLQQFVRKMTAFRKAHPVLRMEEPMRMNDYKGLGYPDLSFHCDSAWTVGFSPNRQSVGMLYCGLYADCEEMIYVAYNFHTGKQFLALPKLPKSKKWYKVMDTGNENGFLEKEMIMDAVQVEIAGMSIQILIGK